MSPKRTRGWNEPVFYAVVNGVPHFHSPGIEWRNNALRSYVVIMNLVNRMMSYGIVPLVDRTKNKLGDRRIAIDAALLLIAAGIYNPNSPGMEPTFMAPCILSWIPDQFKMGFTRNAAAAYEFLTATTMQTVDNRKLTTKSILAMRKAIFSQQCAAEMKWVLRLYAKAWDLEKLRREARTDRKDDYRKDYISVFGKVQPAPPLHNFYF